MLLAPSPKVILHLSPGLLAPIDVNSIRKIAYTSRTLGTTTRYQSPWISREKKRTRHPDTRPWWLVNPVS
jgi:hypothetical protein